MHTQFIFQNIHAPNDKYSF